ncbi:hypothetical protein [Actinacidiphila oryziradicis]|uniref:Uncharacterized protein n=1 Tax=Actinacidiphila oryziradicis TaxID=2571141 RepID=A0A4U0SB41_9ACTN|nr:hypothetical protein [Actinacidiphila oryziradicis]TKA06560.1 hypothetical protein FCI23_31305 [Actinacidiphila oryziradicis]
MADVLVWVMERRVVLAERAERLRKELAEIDAEVGRLEAAEVVIGQFIEAERNGQADDRPWPRNWSGSRPARERVECYWSRTAS